jgi:hypothetical protein
VTIHTLDEFALDTWMVLETREYCALSFCGMEGDCERVFCFVLFLGLVEKI